MPCVGYISDSIRNVFVSPNTINISNSESWLIENIPNRLEFFRNLYPAPLSSVVSADIYKINIPAYPNPTNGNLTAMLEELETDSRINIFNVSGTLVKSAKVIQGKNEIDLGELSNGVYLLYAPNYKVLRVILK